MFILNYLKYFQYSHQCKWPYSIKQAAISTYPGHQVTTMVDSWTMASVAAICQQREVGMVDLGSYYWRLKIRLDVFSGIHMIQSLNWMLKRFNCNEISLSD